MPKTKTSAKTPTLEAYGELQTAYDHYNRAVFQDQLPACLITLHRGSHRVLGYFSHKRFVRLSDGRTATNEIAMSPMRFAGRGITAVLSTLAHEMVRLWQAHHAHKLILLVQRSIGYLPFLRLLSSVQKQQKYVLWKIGLKQAQRYLKTLYSHLQAK
jgi:hypothetical protein